MFNCFKKINKPSNPKYGTNKITNAIRTIIKLSVINAITVGVSIFLLNLINKRLLI